LNSNSGSDIDVLHNYLGRSRITQEMNEMMVTILLTALTTVSASLCEPKILSVEREITIEIIDRIEMIIICRKIRDFRKRLARLSFTSSEPLSEV